MTPAVRKVERAVESQEGTLARRLDERLMRAKGGQIASWTGAVRACSWVDNISAACPLQDEDGRRAWKRVVEARLEDL